MIKVADAITTAATPDKGVAVILQQGTEGYSLTMEPAAARDIAADILAAADRAEHARPRRLPAQPDESGPEWYDEHDERL